MPARFHAPRERFDEEVEPLFCIGTRSGIGFKRHGRGHRQPSPEVEGECLVPDLDMIVELADLSAYAIKASTEGRFHAFRSIGREKRADRGLHHRSLRNALATRIVCKLPGKGRQQAKGMLDTVALAHSSIPSPGSSAARRALACIRWAILRLRFA